MGRRFDRIKDIAKSLLGPKEPIGVAAGPEDMMGKRKQRLDQMGGQNTGGMFDIIFKKRKEREKAVRDIDY